MTLWETARTLFPLTVRRPDEAAARVLTQNWPVEAGWLALILSAAITGLMIGGADQVSPLPLLILDEQGLPVSRLYLSPIAWMVQSLVGALALTWALQAVGKLFGGAGTFTESLWLVAWLEIFMALILLGATVLAQLMPLLGLIAFVAAIILIFRAMGHFSKALHRFDSMGKSALVIVLSFVVASLVTSPVLGLLAQEIPLVTE